MENTKTITIKLLLFMSLIWSVKSEYQCYADEKFPYVYFSARTSYEVNRPRSSFIKTPENCTPKYIWALIRHGTRFPPARKISRLRNLIALRDQIVLNHEEGRGELCEKDLENIKEWKFLLTESLSMQLSLQGKSELSLLAGRLKNQFPSLLSSSSRDDFILTTSETQRTKDSAVVFTNELLGTKYTNVSGNNIPENQQLLCLVEVCPRYEKEVLNSSSTNKELNLFLESNEMKHVLYEVSKKLGFNYTLSYGNVNLMLESCAYENAWHVNSKPAFCAAFTEENLKVFEYKNDLYCYWVEGYGQPINEKMGCNLVRDMMITLRDISQAENPKHKATFYFSHSETILPTTVKLGLNRDSESLRHDNYNKMKDNRNFRLALIDSFASNIIAVLFKCPGHKVDENQVVLYQNEREVIIPGCPESKCSLKLLQQSFEDVFDINRCNSDFCHQISSSSSKFGGFSIYSGIISLVSALVILYY